MTPDAKAQLIKRAAAELGFDRVGFAPASPTPHAAYYREWLSRGYAGSMAYLHRNVPMREDVSNILPGARSVICTAIRYRIPDGESRPRAAESEREAQASNLRSEREAQASAPPSEPGARATGFPAGETPRASSNTPAPLGRIARYALADDYHIILRRRLEALIARMRAEIPDTFDARPFVDTGPILERDLAAAAGLGWIGKNTLLMHERLGSYLFLAEIITTLDLPPDAPATDHCGSCTRCLDACPTHAFPRPYVLDASRCISYFTIEHRGDIPPEHHAAIGDWVYGCDICQEVCPFNHKAPPTADAQLAQPRIPAALPLADLVQLTSWQYRTLTRNSATQRATRKMWHRNAAIALANGEATQPTN
ncbi:MAG: tRNA epoxyqueuosine(34) reductase QueG [Phycisphaerae bacterium]